MRARPRRWMSLVLVAVASILPGAARAALGEGFDNVGPVSPGQHGPSNLIAAGWIFRNQSQPSGPGTWVGDASLPQSGSGSLTVDATVAGFWSATAAASSWALLPAVPGQASGDVLRFWVRDAGSPCCTPQARLQVRYSPGGNTSTGLGATGVGSFTTLLLDLPAVPGRPWTEQSVTLPGNGRLAFRFHLPPQADSADFAGGFSLDALTVGPPVAGPYPLPLPGETVTWTPAMNPILIVGGTVDIPAGGTVVLQPGVQVEVASNSSLRVSGTLQGGGTAGSPVTFGAIAVYPPMIEIAGGTLDLAFSHFAGQVRPGPGATLNLQDSTFAGNGLLLTGGGSAAQPFLDLRRVTFTGSSLTCEDCLVRFEDVIMDDSAVWLVRGYADTTGGLTMNGRPLTVDLQSQIQPVLVDGVTATGVSTGAGLQLSGGNFALGPDNVLQDDLYPVRVEGGLMPESVVPRTGNVHNLIHAGHGGALVNYSLWPNLAVPWFVDGLQDNPHRIIDPGTTVLFGPGGGARYRATARLVAEGRPDAPITFRALDPGERWQHLSSQSNHDPVTLDHCVILDAQGGVSASDAVVWIRNSILRNNDSGGNANTYGILYAQKTLFTGNLAGLSVTELGSIALNFPATPNAIVENAAGVETLGFYVEDDARNTWWGSPTGPQSPGNPGGTGDAITGPGAYGIEITPFLTEAPDFGNHPPVVRLVEPGYTVGPVGPAYHFDPGQTVLLTWAAFDDDAIVSQKILVSGSGNTPASFTTLVDGLPPTARSAWITIPEVGVDPAFWQQFLRVVAVDARGQEGWDELPCVISSGRLHGNVTISSPGAGQVFHAGDDLPSHTRTVTGFEGWFPLVEDHLLPEADGAFYLSGGPIGQLPNVSSDLVRFWTEVRSNTNDVRWFPGPYLTIRHDPRLGFEPPAVELQTPAAGASYPGGGLVPVTWTATAREGLRSFDLQASVDGGRFWRTIATELPATARSFDWRLPVTAAPLADARVRVIARDRRFQNSSDGSDRSFSIVPGASAPGEAALLTAARGAGSSVLLNYAPACGTTDHVAYWGTGPVAGALQWTGSACELGTDGTASLDPGTPAPGTFFYFVVVGQSADAEGSYGTSSSEVPRPEAIGVGACDRAQMLGGCAP